MSEKTTSNTTVRILLASDIHLAFDNIKKLCKFVYPTRESLDYVLLPGDLCNFDPKDCDKSELVSACEGEMSCVISGFESILNKKIYYIPGNHDAKTTLFFEDDKPPKLTTLSENTHRRCVRLNEGVVIMGLGGSLPSIKNGENFWVGYPYQSEEELGKDLHELYSSAKSSGLLKDTDKIILFTHVGPYTSSTSIDQVEIPNTSVYAGSKILNQFILDHQSQILINIHGHTHHGIGMARVGKTFIVNPGSLRMGHYAELILEHYNNELWRMKQVDFKRL